MQALLGSRPRVTMEIQLEGVFYFYVVRPDAISRYLPVTSGKIQLNTVQFQELTDSDSDSEIYRRS
jgi:hypothetical protein